MSSWRGYDLGTLVIAPRLSRRAMGLVGQNIGVVARPNAIVLAVATGGLSPLLPTAAYNGSTLVAGLNALRPLRSARAPAPAI